MHKIVIQWKVSLNYETSKPGTSKEVNLFLNAYNNSNDKNSVT